MFFSFGEYRVLTLSQAQVPRACSSHASCTFVPPKMWHETSLSNSMLSIPLHFETQ